MKMCPWGPKKLQLATLKKKNKNTQAQICFISHNSLNLETSVIKLCWFLLLSTSWSTDMLRGFMHETVRVRVQPGSREFLRRPSQAWPEPHRRSVFRVQTQLKDDRKAKVLSLSAVWLTFHEGINCIHAPPWKAAGSQRFQTLNHTDRCWKAPICNVFGQSEGDQSVSFEVKKAIALFEV